MPRVFASLALTTPKLGEPDLTNCDRVLARDAAFRWVVADGASQSYRAGDWAELIARVSADKGRFPDDESIKRSADQMTDGFSETTDWLESELRSSGSRASVLVAVHRGECDNNGATVFELQMAGDCLAVAVAVDGRHRTWPFNVRTDFPAVPASVSSIPPFVRGDVHEGSIAVPAGGLLFLMTDGLGRFLVEYLERYSPDRGVMDAFSFLYGGIFSRDSRAIEATDVQSHFESWALDARESGLLEDDDLTLLIVEPSL